MSSREQDLVGRVLGNRYDVLELLGSGGMGAVYRARDRELDEQVAIKVIRGDLARSADMLERFRSEVKLARRVTHTNVARTFELGRADQLVFCTMELVEGESLTCQLRARHHLTLAEAVAIACALCDGLAAAHAVGVIHRDLKPDNVLIARDGRVVLADFGVAALATEAGDVSGTPAYMAPEQARGEPATPAADVYAVGVVLYEMLTGHRAFAGDAARVLADKQVLERVAIAQPDVPVELARVIAGATARELADRIATASALRRGLAAWLRAPRQLATTPAPARATSDVTTIVVL
ncbi:MAG TPA: serine/threonine-protein kinase, partial [Kofleriaceae bacterium]|nr:serine/threonine-protein kinase [Kofleriaceae bacterium]